LDHNLDLLAIFNKYVIKRNERNLKLLEKMNKNIILTKNYNVVPRRLFYYCPAIISHRPRSQNILKEQALNSEKDSRIKRPRSQVSLEKSSQNYKPLEK